MRPTGLLVQAVAAGTILLCSGVARAETITLSDAIERALKFAPAAALASAAMDFGEAEARERSASLLPSISAQGEYEQTPGFDSRITNRGQTDALLMLDYTAYDFGRRAAGVRAARYAAEAAQLGVGAERAQIAYDVKVAYFDLLRNLHLELELESSLDRMTRYVAITRALVSTGKAIANDALKVEVARDDVELALVAARRARERASVTLGSMVGEWGKTDLKAVEVESIATAPVATAPGGDLARSPALQAARRQVQSALLEEQAAEAERYPRFQLALSGGFLGVDPRDTFDQRAGASYDGLVSVPIFEGGAITARIDQARARLHQTEAAARQVELELNRRWSQAALKYREASEAIAVLARAQPAAEDSFALSWARFLGGGGVTMLEVLDGYQKAEQIRLDRVDCEFAAREAAAESALVLGLSQ